MILVIFVTKLIDLERLKAQNKDNEKEIERLNQKNNKKINDYLSSLEDPAELERLGKSFQGMTDQYRDSINQINDDKDALVGQLGQASDEYAELVKNNYRQRKKKMEMQNEIETLQNLIANNCQLKDDTEKLDKDYSRVVGDKNQGLGAKIRNQDEDYNRLEREYGN